MNNSVLAKRLDVTTARGYLTRMYGNIFLDLLVSFITAFLVAQHPEWMQMMSGGAVWILALVVFMGLGFAVQRTAMVNPGLGQALALAFSAFIGTMLSYVFYFPARLVIGAGICTLAVFLAMTMFGLTTGMRLEKMSTFLFVTLIGIIVASIVNLFLRSGGLGFVISVASVIIFTLYLAYDTNVAMKAFGQADNNNVKYCKGLAVVFGLNLFIDIINLFEAILEIFGWFSSNR